MTTPKSFSGRGRRIGRTLRLAAVACLLALPTIPACTHFGGSGLVPARAFLTAEQIPPADVGGYGVVALRAKPTSASGDRLQMLCRSYLATLPAQHSLPPFVEKSRQLITIWPIDAPAVVQQGSEDCALMLDHYDLYTGQAAIADAVAQGRKLSGRGPFLIGWAPSGSRYVRDAVVLVVDMSQLDTQSSFDEALLFWQRKIVEDPARWKSGFSLNGLRLALREFADEYGSDILQAVKLDPR